MPHVYFRWLKEVKDHQLIDGLEKNANCTAKELEIIRSIDFTEEINWVEYDFEFPFLFFTLPLPFSNNNLKFPLFNYLA